MEGGEKKGERETEGGERGGEGERGKCWKEKGEVRVGREAGERKGERVKGT